MKPAWVWAVLVGDGETSMGMDVGTDVGVQGVVEGGVVIVTASVGGVGCWALAWL